jgi:AraC-like DNA-binding protein
MIYAFGAFIAFFLAVLLPTKKGRTTADLVLTVWLVVIGLHLAMFYVFRFVGLFTYPHLLGVPVPFPFLHGPMLYLYTLALTNPEKFTFKQCLYHGLLPMGVALSIAPFCLQSAEYKIFVFSNDGIGYKTHLLVWRILLFLSGIYYIIFTYILLQNHKKRILDHFSNQEKINLNWLRFLFYGMTVLWFVILGIGGDENIFPAATVFLFLIGYFGIKQVGIFTNQIPALQPAAPLVEDSVEAKPKYLKSGLSQEAAISLRLHLTEIMQEQKLYCDPELTLADLANRLQTHPNYLSQIINEKEGITFYEYVNRMRIAEFLERVQQPENQKYTLMALAYDCGFNSKTSFNRNFKKITQSSPSDYLMQRGIVLK